MASSPYGFWTFGGKNGLVGGPSTTEALPDGRTVTHKHESLPAVLPDEHILDILSRSPQARVDFERIYPTLDQISQARLTDLITNNRQLAKLIVCEQDLLDSIQRVQVTSGVR